MTRSTPASDSSGSLTLSRAAATDDDPMTRTRTLIAPSTAARDAAGRARTYEVRTFGCQMNVHDSERLSGSLEAAGYVPAEGDEADIVVLNTCAVRENGRASCRERV